MTTSHDNKSSDDADAILMNELRINDDKLTKEMYDVILNPIEMLNVLSKKLQLYNETEAVLVDPKNKLILGFMKIAIENRMIVTQIKKDMDDKVSEITGRLEKLEKENNIQKSEQSQLK